MVSEIVLTVLRDHSGTNIVVEDDKPKKPAGGAAAAKKPRRPRIKSIEEIPCPVCGKGHLVKGRTAYGCSEYASGCRMLLPFDKYAPTLTPAKLRALVEKNFKKDKKQ